MATTVPTPKTPIVLQEDGTVDILIKQGSTWRLPFIHAGIADPTGYTARMMLRVKYDDDTPLVSITSPTEITIALDPLGTRFDLEMSDTKTASLTDMRGVWDVEVVAPAAGGVDRVLQGKWYLSLEVTK